jgi:hypothetical protein
MVTRFANPTSVPGVEDSYPDFGLIFKGRALVTDIES